MPQLQFWESNCTLYSLLQCQSSSGSAGKSIWLTFRRPRFKSWLDLNVPFPTSANKTPFNSLTVSHTDEHLAVWYENRWTCTNRTPPPQPLSGALVTKIWLLCEWFISHTTPPVCFSSNFILLADRQTDGMDCVLTPAVFVGMWGNKLKVRATYHSTIALVLASSEISLQ